MNMLACLFALAGVYVFYRALRSEKQAIAINMMAGILLALAVGTKISYVFVPIVVVLYALYCFRVENFAYSATGVNIPCSWWCHWQSSYSLLPRNRYRQFCVRCL